MDDLEVTLREAAAKVPEEPFQQATRPADAYTLGNHPAFRGIGGAGDGPGSVGDAGSEGYDETKGVAEAEAAAAAGNKREAIVVKVLRNDIGRMTLFIVVVFFWVFFYPSRACSKQATILVCPFAAANAPCSVKAYLSEMIP